MGNENTLLTIIMVLIALLFVRDVAVQYLKKIFGVKTTEEPEEKTPIWAQKLVNHFNHQTTDLLSEIAKGQREANMKLDEIIKYGVINREK
jgi:hypothetical protein